MPARTTVSKIAGVLTVWGAATGHRWVVPLAAMLALPTIWMQSFSMLLGCVALYRDREAPAPWLTRSSWRRTAGTPTTTR